MAVHVDMIQITTNVSGAATVYGRPFVGLLHELIYVPGTLHTNADLTITDDATGAAILTITNAGTSVLRKAPRIPTVDASNSASLYAGGGEPVEDRMSVVSRIKVVVAEGDDTKSGRLYVVWED